jgi:hypothetical protein
MGDTKPFTIPHTLLSQLNECSFGGFILFVFDDQGSPRVYTKTDNDMSYLALENQISKWLYSMEEAEKQLNARNIVGSGVPPKDDEPSEID